MYFVIDTFMTKELHLKKTELLVYGLIYSFSRLEGSYYESVKVTADALGVTHQSVKNALRSLQEKRLIRKAGKKKVERGYVNKYKAIVPKSVTIDGAKNLPPTQQDICADGAKNLDLPGKKFAPINKSIINIDNKDDSQLSLVELMRKYGAL